jgi:hypothetical protein
MNQSTTKRTWTPHLWVLVPPVGAVVIGYALWWLLIIVLSLKLPPWWSRLLHGWR